MRERWTILFLMVAVFGCGDDGEGGPVTPTATVTITPTRSATTVRTATPTPTVATVATATATRVSLTPPLITLFAVARADDTLVEPIGTDAEGRPIFERPSGSGFTLVLEARRGPSQRPVGLNAFDEAGGEPDVQLLVSRPLGDGSPTVCALDLPQGDGVPAVDPPQFSGDAAVVAAINDLGCRVNDGTGTPSGRPTSSSACTLSPDDFGYGFVSDDTEVQYCLPVARTWKFPSGDTIVAARVRDQGGHLSAVHEIVVRVRPGGPTCDDSEREFTVRRSGSGLFSSASPGVDVSTTDPWYAEPIRLCAAPQSGNGARRLNLLTQAILGLRLADQRVLCVRLLPDSTVGVLDCSGRSTGVSVAQDSRGDTAADVPVARYGIGANSGPGGAMFSAGVSFVLLDPEAQPEECGRTNFGPVLSLPVTTANGLAQVLNPTQGGEVQIQMRGQNFDCANFTTSDSAGALVIPFTDVDGATTDTANLLFLAD